MQKGFFCAQTWPFGIKSICTFDVMKIKKEEHFALPFLYAVIWKEGQEDSCLKHLNQKNQRNLPV